MSVVALRKIVTSIEETTHDGGAPLAMPVRKGAIGRYIEDIAPMMDALKPLAFDLTKRLLATLDVEGKQVDGYGKAVIVGVAGELEHAALWHQPSGWGIREAMGGAKSIVPSTVKVGAAGVRIDVPLHHAHAAYVRSHFDSIEFAVPDGPRPDEIVFVVALAIGGRPHPRVGGLKASEIKLWDGQR
jgi:hypothetical protein